MTWLARLSVHNRAIVGLVTVLVVAFGLVSTTSLRQELLPPLDLPVVSVVTPYAGASPEVVEQQVTIPVEDAVGSLSGVSATRSTSTGGSSVVTLEVEYGTDLAEFSTQADRALQGARLPEDVTPTVVSGGVDDLPVVQLAVSSNLPPDQLADVLRDQVQPLLAGLDGVADVTLSGIRDPRVTVELDAAAAAERGVSPSDVATVLQDNGVRTPAGQLASDTDPLTVEIGGPITSAEQLADLYLTPARGGDPVRLGDIATVRAEPAPATGDTRTDGAPSIGIGITKQEDANTVAVSHEVDEALPEIVDLLGGAAQDAQATVVFDQAPFIEQSVEDLTTEGLLGLVFAVLVILGFLLSVRATLVTAVSIPLSVLIAMGALYVGGHTLNILTLGALTVAVGRVVDDSIVVIENIKRHIGLGGPRTAAILTAVREVAGAITASTITTVAVFAPIGLVGGQVGELFRPFAVTVTAALLASLLVSLTVVPVLASLVLRRPARPEKESGAGRMQRGYLPVLRAAIARPVLSLGVAVAILAGTVALVPLLQTNFLGDAGGGTLAVRQELAPGTALPQADAAAQRVEEVLSDTEGVASYQVTVGSPGGAAGGFGPRAGTGDTRFSVTLEESADATAVADDLRARLADLGPPAEVGTLTVQGGAAGFGNDELEVEVTAQDPDVLARAADQVQQAVAAIPGATDVRNDLAAAQESVDVAVDQEAAAAAGLTEAGIGRSVAAALRGTPIGTVTVDGVEQDVVLRTGAAPADLAALEALPLAGAGGPTTLGPTTLGEVATVTRTTTAPSIGHIDGDRSASITARPDADDLGAVGAELRTALDELDLPAGATAEIGGISEEQDEAFAQLGLALLVAIAVVYLVMVVTFRSLLQPLLLLVSIPFAGTGALGLLLVTGTPLGVAALIGMLMLVGIVVTNAIVLIDLVNQYRRAGRKVDEAVVEGAAQRLRPILMTAVATIFALLPMAFGITGGSAFISQPLAIVVIGGLVSSTLLTLVLVPVLYVLVERVRGRGRPDAGPAVPASAPEAVPSGAGVDGRVTDRGGVPLPGAVLLVVDATGAQVATTAAGADGRFPVDLPGAGEYLLVGRYEGLEPTAEWLVATDDARVGHDMVVEGPASVEGRIRQAGGAGVAALVTAADRAGAPVAGTRADGAGHYRLAHVPAGELHLTIAPPGGAAVTQRVQVPATGVLRHDVTLPPTGVLTGVVRSGHGGGVGGAVATVTDAAGTVVATGRTAADGSFRLAGLPEGAYTVTAVVGGPAASTVEVRDGVITAAELELR
ncbi:efflux RND transporter permease subunit [Pseudonocardia nigra]|uniref:efflux RND transporter permease subunit n=1 Tax=Pseudonocardia nigra TaxID=1921578 RepID=UPI001C5E49BC|nr:efflux RND transporter permease subunit [Pseudonocardia nigra]